MFISDSTIHMLSLQAYLKVFHTSNSDTQNFPISFPNLVEAVKTDEMLTYR